MKNRKKIMGLILAGTLLMQVNTSKAYFCSVSPIGALFVLGAAAGPVVCIAAAGIAVAVVGCKVIKHVSSPEEQRKREERRRERKAKRDARKAAKKKSCKI